MRSWFQIAAGLLMVQGSPIAGEPVAARVALSQTQVDQIISRTQDNFWGKAVGLDGKLLSPADEGERQKLLIPRADAARVVNEAHKYGLALWCDLDWKPTYSKYMHTERERGWTEKQIAFVGMLFGMTQSTVRRLVGGTCEQKDKRETQQAMSSELRRLSGDDDR